MIDRSVASCHPHELTQSFHSNTYMKVVFPFFFHDLLPFYNQPPAQNTEREREVQRPIKKQLPRGVLQHPAGGLTNTHLVLVEPVAAHTHFSAASPRIKVAKRNE